MNLYNFLSLCHIFFNFFVSKFNKYLVGGNGDDIDSLKNDFEKKMVDDIKKEINDFIIKLGYEVTFNSSDPININTKKDIIKWE